ncbi:MAG TPA: acyltransferase [Gemmatimonadaceae bacterium]|nr:acyltransferase [Gemmatimonadaceae bacterium]
MHAEVTSSAGAPATDTARYRALDGVRGLAIVVVVIHNSGAVWGERNSAALKAWALFSNAGWIGVQLFFALSGFLITRILLENAGKPGALRSFYVRRFLRIVPLYYATLLFVFYVTPQVSFLSPIADPGTRSQFWYWAYLSNWLTPFGGMVPALPHIWSLAVEEQFYLLWPLALIALKPRRLAFTCVAIVGVAFVVRGVLHVLFPPAAAEYAAYTFTISRWDAIALGALVALLQRDARATFALTSRFHIVLGLAIATLFVTTLVNRGLPAWGRVTEIVGMPFSAIASALVVLACVSDADVRGSAATVRRALRRALSAKWLAWTGKFSYGIYMFHLPVHIVLQRHIPASLSTASSGNVRFVALLAYVGCVFVVSSALAVVSWFVLEQPMLSLKRYFPMARA